MKNVDIKILALSIVGAVLILLAIGGVINAATDGEGLDPSVASAAFAILGAMVAGAFGTQAVIKDKKTDDDEEY